ncbi:hypothetical protein L6452_30838 [Arctium lappa]|uniref:Uncharacterized protein n=1 Tax=Arctium lappa TaxID=4217 RepID=A0ACB8ZJR8_ARCLA|nr:hypothetical protein L6452_30838 [Arctium lappa]
MFMSKSLEPQPPPPPPRDNLLPLRYSIKHSNTHPPTSLFSHPYTLNMKPSPTITTNHHRTFHLTTRTTPVSFAAKPPLPLPPPPPLTTSRGERRGPSLRSIYKANERPLVSAIDELVDPK